MDMKLEVVVVPVADVDRAKEFYTGLGWREDADFAPAPDYRVVQVTPPGSDCSVIFGAVSSPRRISWSTVSATRCFSPVTGLTDVLL